MHIPLASRLLITLCNIFFPPLAVALLTGATSHDTLLNACLFLLAIIPSHVHGFYISAVYFTRKRRVRKGRWPGKEEKRGVWSEKVLTGGVGWEGARELKRKEGGGEGSDFENGRVRGKGARSRSRNRNRSKRSSRRESGGQGAGGDRRSKRVSRVQSHIQEPVERRTQMQETGQITNGEMRNTRTSRWVEDL